MKTQVTYYKNVKGEFAVVCFEPRKRNGIGFGNVYAILPDHAVFSKVTRNSVKGMTEISESDLPKAMARLQHAGEWMRQHGAPMTYADQTACVFG